MLIHGHNRVYVKKTLGSSLQILRTDIYDLHALMQKPNLLGGYDSYSILTPYGFVKILSLEPTDPTAMIATKVQTLDYSTKILLPATALILDYDSLTLLPATELLNSPTLTLGVSEAEYTPCGRLQVTPTTMHLTGVTTLDSPATFILTIDSNATQSNPHTNHIHIYLDDIETGYTE